MADREEQTRVGPQGLTSLFGQSGDQVWWRPLLIPFRPIVIFFNLLIKSRPQFTGTLGRSPQPSYTNEQTYDITWDEKDRPVRVTVHRAVHEA